MTVNVLPVLADNYCYILEDNGRAAVVDPSEAIPIERYLRKKNLKLEVLLCTHHHHDHVGGALELARQFAAPIWCSSVDMPRIDGATRGLIDNEIVEIVGSRMQVLSVPGHTRGQVAFYFERERALFVGDTLFSLGCGRLFEGSAEEMYTSLNRLSSLPSETLIYFGHEYTLKNVEFAMTLYQTQELKSYFEKVTQLREQNKYTSPTFLETELKLNPFLNAPNLAEWTRRRQLRNSY